jgi:UPF0716 protein FxsA
MLETRSLIRLFDTGYILKLFFTIMLLSLLPFADMWAVLYIDKFVPRYLLLAGIASTALVGLVLTFLLIKRLLGGMLARIRDGYYPGVEFFHLIGLLIAGILLLTPGFIGDVFGIFLLVPTFRAGFARLVARKMENRFKELYEYLKLYEL